MWSILSTPLFLKLRFESNLGFSMNFLEHFEEVLAGLSEAGRYRSLTPFEGVGGRFNCGGRTVLNFSSNDYLNLANDERLKKAGTDAIERFGTGATASRLMSGDLALHEELESALAKLVRQDSALVFASGYQMNAGIVSGLFDETWTIFSDALNHASIVDGCRLSRAKVVVYPHNDVAALEEALLRAEGYKAIVTESVFSMDGDIAPLDGIAALARAHGAMLLVDEAHAIGIYGTGGGVCEAIGIRPDITLGTLGKSLGSAGGFAACAAMLRDVMINRVRPMIFSTGLAPACAGAALAAVRIVEETPELGPALRERSRALRSALRGLALEVDAGDSPIVPVIVGEDRAAVALSQALLEQGIVAKAVRPPTVPEGTSRLRISLTLAHREEDLRRLVKSLEAALVAGA